MPLTRTLGAAAALLIGVVCAALYLEVRANAALTGWEEIAWPFPRDAWPPGRAFRCKPESCANAIEIYVRPKIGFCNCAAGVSDDDEVDRVTDLDLISERFAPLAPGREVRFAGLPGRSRRYVLTMPDGTRREAAGLAVSLSCDVVVAATHGKAMTSFEQERAAVELLSSKEIGKWVRVSTGRT